MTRGLLGPGKDPHSLDSQGKGRGCPGDAGGGGSQGLHLIFFDVAEKLQGQMDAGHRGPADVSATFSSNSPAPPQAGPIALGEVDGQKGADHCNSSRSQSKAVWAVRILISSREP